MSQQINLFNPIFRPQTFSPTSAATLAAGVGILVVLAVLVGVYQDYRTREVASQAQAVRQQLDQATATRDKLAAQAAAQKTSAGLEAELIQLEARLKGRQDIVEALSSGVLGSTSGFAPYMRAFSRQTVNGLWLTGFDIASAGPALAIQGRTLSADLLPNYLKRLNEEEALQGRQFAKLQVSLPKTDAASAPAADAKAAKPPPPRFLEFNLTSGDDATLASSSVSMASRSPGAENKK